MISEKIKKEARKFALKNALDYGKADVSAVLGKVLAANPRMKDDVRSLAVVAKAAVQEVNKMKKQEIEKELEPYSEEFERLAEAKAEKGSKPRMEITGAEEGKVVTRYPPEPGGYMPIGNAKQCILSDELAKKYDGKIYLYFDDTNPEKSRQEYVDGIKRDTEWLGVRFAKEYFASDYIEKIYESGRRLLEHGDAYVCLCDENKVKKDRADKNECVHRLHTKQRNLELFDEMLAGKYAEGIAIVRLLGDMNSDNAAFRDPTLFRIKKAAHFRQGSKYAVWPTYHINTPVVDYLNGVTDVIRGKEYEIWDEVNKKMLQALGIKPPRMHYEARLRIKGSVGGKRDIRKLIKEGIVATWDDPRLLTIAALRRRGIQPQAIKNFVLRFGMSKTDAVVNIEMLLAENKKIIEPMARHLFFVELPVKFVVKGAKKKHVKLRLHPTDHSEFREYDTGGTFYISYNDAKSLKNGDVVRLKDLFDAKVISKGKDGVAAEPAPSAEGGKIIQWVSDENYVDCSIVIPTDLVNENGDVIKDSLRTVKGYVESYAERLSAHEIVQFERVGYCILDDAKERKFIFTSK